MQKRQRIVRPIAALLLWGLLAACGDSATPAPAGITPLANTPAASTTIASTTAASTTAASTTGAATTSTTSAVSATTSAATMGGTTAGTNIVTAQPTQGVLAKPTTADGAAPTPKAPTAGPPKATAVPTSPVAVPTDAPTPTINVSDFPLPPGAKRDPNAGQGQANEAVTDYTVTGTVAQLADFYLNALPKQGWQPIDDPANLKSGGAAPGTGNGVGWQKGDRHVDLSITQIPNSGDAVVELVAHMLPAKLTLAVSGKETLNGATNVDAPTADSSSSYGLSGVYIINGRYFDLELNLSAYTGGNTYTLDDTSSDLTIAFGKDPGEVADANPYQIDTANGTKKCSVTVAADQKSGSIACTLSSPDNASDTIDLKASWTSPVINAG